VWVREWVKVSASLLVLVMAEEMEEEWAAVMAMDSGEALELDKHMYIQTNIKTCEKKNNKEKKTCTMFERDRWNLIFFFS
jgi:hypothetical protein